MRRHQYCVAQTLIGRLCLGAEVEIFGRVRIGD